MSSRGSADSEAEDQGARQEPFTGSDDDSDSNRVLEGPCSPRYVPKSPVCSYDALGPVGPFLHAPTPSFGSQYLVESFIRGNTILGHRAESQLVAPTPPPNLGLVFVQSESASNAEYLSGSLRIGYTRDYSSIAEEGDAAAENPKRQRIVEDPISSAEDDVWLCVVRGKKAGIVYGK